MKQLEIEKGFNMDYPTRIDLCGGKCSVIYDFKTGQSECLYYGEKLINGVLHWRETLDGEWKPMSPEKLTDLVIQLRKALQAATARGQFHNERLTIAWPPQPVVTCKGSESK